MQSGVVNSHILQSMFFHRRQKLLKHLFKTLAIAETYRWKLLCALSGKQHSKVYSNYPPMLTQLT